MTAPADLLDAARSGDAGAFEELVAPYRAELQAHCYLMPGAHPPVRDPLPATGVGVSRVPSWPGPGTRPRAAPA